MTSSGADFALSIDAPSSATAASDFDVMLRGTSVQRLIAYSALLEYDTTALSLLTEATGFSGTVWATADFRSVTQEPGGRIRVAAVAELPSVPGGPSFISAGENLAFLKLRFRAASVKSGVRIGFAGTVDDNLLADVNLVGHDTANGLVLTPATLSVVDDLPEIDVTPLSLSYGEMLVGVANTRQVVVENAGVTALEVMSVSLGSGTSNDFQIIAAPTLPAELAPGGSFQVRVRYRPSNVGADNGTLLIESDDPDEPIVTVALSGSGVPEPSPEIDVFPVSIDYGEIVVGSSSNRNIRVRNIGSGALVVSAVQLTGTVQDFLLNALPTLPATVAPGAELVFKARYTPSGSGADSAFVEIESDDADEAVATVPLSGSGVELVDPEIDVSPLSVDFGAVIIGTTDDETLRIANLGTTALGISTLELGPSTSPDFSLGSLPALPASIVPGGELLVHVIYGPSGAGADSGTLLIGSNDVDESSLSVPLSGTGSATPAPEIDLSGAQIDFGLVEIGSPADVALRIRNQGTLPLEITTLMLNPPTSADYTLSGVPGLPHTISPAGELVLSVTYSPRQLGSDSGTVLILSNDEDEGTLNVVLKGFGIPEQRQGIVAHLPLNCSAEDIINDETGLAIGTVRCGPDRFDVRNRAIDFGDGGFIAGLRFPVVAGDFVLDAWVRPKPGSERSPAEIFVIHNEQSPIIVPALTVEWEKDTHLVRVKRASGGSVEFGGLTEDWHHLLVARQDGMLSLYVDGQLKGSMEYADILGGAYTLGAAPRGVQVFHGSLDELILEAGTLGGEDGVIARTLRGGPTAYVHPSDRVKVISVSPGFTVEALDLRISSANPAGLELTRLELMARDVTPEGGESPALDYLLNGRLVLQSECGDEDSEVRVADLVVSELDGGSARIELTGLLPALIPGEACLVALFDLDSDAPLDREIQFSLERYEDLELIDFEDRVQYLAGERLLDQVPLQGDRMRIRTAVPPELELEFSTSVPTVQATGGVDDAEMHVLTLGAGASEGLKLVDVTYRAAPRTSLDGVSNVRLFADLNSNGQLDANEESRAGSIDVASGSVAFSGVGIEVPSGGQVDLVLLADLEFFEEPVEEEGSEGAFTLPLPLSGPGMFPQVPLLVLAALFAFVLVARERCQPKLAGMVALVAVGCMFGFGAGCSGGGGGGGGGGSGATLSQSFQLMIESEDDLRVEGLQSRTEPALDDFPANGIPGAVYVVRQAP